MTTTEQLNRTILLCRDYIAESASDDEICGALQSLRVLFVSDLRNLSSNSGQTALITFVSLLTRMGIPVWLRIPEVRLLVHDPLLSGPSLRSALIESSETHILGATVQEDSGIRADLTFALGDTAAVGYSPSWRMTGSEWYGCIAANGPAIPQPWAADWPIGSMVSAALAASEAFKLVMRRLPLRQLTDEPFFEPSPTCSWDFGPVRIPEEGVRLGEVDIVSAGAICQAALYVLLRLPRVEMWGRVFDDDLTGPSNLNRNMLTNGLDKGPKVDIVARRCRPKLRLRPIPHRFPLASTETPHLSPKVLVGVDDIASRWAVQRRAHGWLGLSGTSHFSVSSSEHTPDKPCCGCLHPLDDPADLGAIPTVSFVSFWAGLTMAVRLIRETLGLPFPDSKQHLWLAPLRLDLLRAGIWMPVAPHPQCPVGCAASRATSYRPARPILT